MTKAHWITFRMIGGRRYQSVQRYPTYSGALREAARWLRSPGVHAKVVGPDGRAGYYTLWVRTEK